MRPHDAAYKRLLSFPDMVRDLLTGFIPGEWVGDLDLFTPCSPNNCGSTQLSTRCTPADT